MGHLVFFFFPIANPYRRQTYVLTQEKRKEKKVGLFLDEYLCQHGQ